MTEENGTVTKKIRDLISFNQDKVEKLKAGIKTTQEETEVQRVEVKLGKRIADKMEALEKRARSLKEKVEQEKTANKKFQRERDVLMKELKRLREDNGTVDNLNKKLEHLKKELNIAKKSSTSSGLVTEDIVKEEDTLIKKYEDMLNGGLDPGEDGILPSEIIRELKEEVDDQEKERRTMIVKLKRLKEDNAGMDMKITLLENEKNRGDKSGTDEGIFSGIVNRSAQTSEFSSGLENFLITYSDMVTLLLVIFVLMFSISKMDGNKFAKALSSFQPKRMRIESVNVRLDKDELKMPQRIRELVKKNVDAENLV